MLVYADGIFYLYAFVFTDVNVSSPFPFCIYIYNYIYNYIHMSLKCIPWAGFLKTLAKIFERCILGAEILTLAPGFPNYKLSFGYERLRIAGIKI